MVNNNYIVVYKTNFFFNYIFSLFSLNIRFFISVGLDSLIAKEYIYKIVIRRKGFSYRDSNYMDMPLSENGLNTDYNIFLKKTDFLSIHNHLTLKKNTIKTFLDTIIIWFFFFFNKLNTFKSKFISKQCYSITNFLLITDILDNYCYTKRISTFMGDSYKFIDHMRYFNIRFLDLSYVKLDTLTILNLLKQRYGVGNTIVYLICKFLGIPLNIKTNALPITIYYHQLSYLFANNLSNLDNHLMDFVLSRHMLLKQMKSYRGFRLFNGYPSHGQRTRSNYRSSFRRSYKFSFYFVDD